MSAVFKIFLSMSFSGGLLILALLFGKRFLKDKISRQWQYYIWLIVVLRLLLPFGSEVNLLGNTYQAVEQAITQAAPLPPQLPAANTPKDALVSAVGLEQNHETVNPRAENLTTAPPLQEIGVLLANHVWLIWLVVTLGLLLRKITIYQGFMRYVKAGLTPVSELAVLDRLSIAAERAGVQKPVELCVNPLVSSPLLIGFFHPCIVLPSADIAEKDFQYIVLHELTHYKRRDMFYKWLVQITVCLHWFNPLVHLMSREITRACEFSCDEAVLAKMGCENARDYGKTLLDAMAAVGKYKENLGSVTLSENKQLLKERLGAIMNFKKKSTAIRLLTGALTLCVMFGAAFIGVYPTAAAESPNSVTAEKSTPSQTGQRTEMETLTIKGTTYYFVQNEAQLRAIGTGKYGMDQNYMQQADIQLSSDEWTPIGTWENPFTGTFTGNGFEIKGLTMTDPNAKIIGLFGVAKNAHIYNVTLRDYDIASAGKDVSGKSVGAVLAIGQGSRSYDNFVYPKETGINQEMEELDMENMEKTLQMVKKYLPLPGTEFRGYVFLGPDDLWMGTIESQRPFVVVAEDRWPGGGGFLLIVMADGPVYIAELDFNDTAKPDCGGILDLGQDSLVDYCAADFPKFIEIMTLYFTALETTPNPDDMFDEEGNEKLAEAEKLLRQQIEKIDPKAIEDLDGFWSVTAEEFGAGMW